MQDDVEKLVEDVALAIQTAWVAQADKLNAESGTFAGREDDLAHMAEHLATPFFKPFAKAAIKATYEREIERVTTIHPWTDKEVAISDYLITRLKQLEG